MNKEGGNSSDLCTNSTLVVVFLLLGVDPLADGGTDLHVAAMFPNVFYE